MIESNMIKIILLLLHLSLSVFAYDKVTIPNKGLSHESKKNLESISKYAIKIGTGTLHKTYIFIDPMCPFSKKYIAKLTKNKMAQALNSYYIFLYKLPKFKSNKVSQFIYQSKNKSDALKSIMIDNKNIDLNMTKEDKDIQALIDEIARVGEKLKVKQRPYIMSFEKGSIYCTVSSGSAPCLEELNFN